MDIKIAAALVFICASGAALAQDDQDGQSGLHNFAGLRGSIAFDSSLSAKASTAPPTSLHGSFGTGGGASFYMGTRLPYGFRVEFEGLFRDLPLSDGTLNGTHSKLGGYEHMFAPLANVYWTPPISDWGFYPFLGGGSGYAWNELKISSVAGVPVTGVRGDGWRLVYNAFAGVSVPFNDSSRFTVMYRWLHEDIGLNCGGSLSCSGNLNSQSLDLGIEMDM